MKKYKIRYWDEDKSKPLDLTQWSKSGKWHGAAIVLYTDGIKEFQENWNNDFAYGCYKVWYINSKNHYFQNWKKHKTQGVEIGFKR